jgi:hypothetical protein
MGGGGRLWIARASPAALAATLTFSNSSLQP